MATYVLLANWTEQGIRDYKSTTDRAERVAALMQKHGGRLVSIHWTLGAYDVVAISEAPDDETAAAIGLAIGALGNVRTVTLRAFDRTEMADIVAKAAG